MSNTQTLLPGGTRKEREALERSFAFIERIIDTDEWRRQKDELFARSSSDEVWNSPERMELLGRAEYMDRIEAGLEGARKILARLEQSASDGGEKVSKNLLALSAQQIYLVRMAEESLRLGIPVMRT